MPRRPLTLFFLACIAGVPLVQAGLELARGERVQALSVVGPLEEQRLRGFEEDLREASFLHQRVTPIYNRLLYSVFGRGNEKALPIGSRLQYGEDLDALTVRAHHADRAADTVIDLAEQLAARGVKLVLVPVAPKALADLAPASSGVPAFRRFDERLAAAGVTVVTSEGEPEYLERDTHWTSAMMQRMAAATAQAVRDVLGRGPQPRANWWTSVREVRGAGDLVGMLHWPDGFEPWPPMVLRTDYVWEVSSEAPFAPVAGAELLLLGDSFTRVFSDPELGLGRAAGFDAHLARQLASKVDVIAIPGGSALAVREALARRVRTAGLGATRVVVWQISLRDLVGDEDRWRPIALGEAAVAEPPAAVPAGPLVVEARITEVTRLPKGFDYSLLLAIHEYEVERVVEGELAAGPLWVAHIAIERFEETAAAAWPVGESQRLRLEPLADHYDLEETSWVDDTRAGRDIWFATEVTDSD